MHDAVFVHIAEAFHNSSHDSLYILHFESSAYIYSLKQSSSFQELGDDVDGWSWLEDFNNL